MPQEILKDHFNWNSSPFVLTFEQIPKCKDGLPDWVDQERDIANLENNVKQIEFFTPLARYSDNQHLKVVISSATILALAEAIKEIEAREVPPGPADYLPF